MIYGMLTLNLDGFIFLDFCSDDFSETLLWYVLNQYKLIVEIWQKYIGKIFAKCDFFKEFLLQWNQNK